MARHISFVSRLSAVAAPVNPLQPQVQSLACQVSQHRSMQHRLAFRCGCHGLRLHKMAVRMSPTMWCNIRKTQEQRGQHLATASLLRLQPLSLV